MILDLIVLAGVAMLIAALVRPFRRASDASPFEDAQALRKADADLSVIERKDDIEGRR